MVHLGKLITNYYVIKANTGTYSAAKNGQEISSDNAMEIESVLPHHDVT